MSRPPVDAPNGGPRAPDFVAFFVGRPIFAAVVAILITLAGAISIPLLRVSQFPPIAPPTVQVTANYNGASADVVERTVTLPIAVSGGLLAALIDGGTLSFGSVIALFAVFGLAVRNAMQLIQRIRQLEQAGAELDSELVVRGARDRAVPIVGTAVAAGLVLAPFVVMGGIAGYELVHPMAVVALGGLVTSTWLTLFVVPVLYLRLGPTAVPEPSPATAGGLVDDLLPREPAAPLPGGAHAAVHQASVQREPGP